MKRSILVNVRSYMMAAFALTAAAPLIVFWLWPYSGILAQKYDEVWERHLLIAQNLGSAMDTYHRDLIASMESFATPIVYGAADEAQAIFRNLYFRHVCVAEVATGKVVRTYFSDEHKCPTIVPAERLTEFEHLARENSVGMSGVVAPPNAPPRIFLVKRVDDFLVVGAVHTDFFLKLQRRISFGRLGHAAIVDGNGRILAHPNEEWTATARDVSSIAPVARMMNGETGVEVFFSPAMQLEMVAGFTSLPVAGWGVMVPQPTNELSAAAASFNHEALIILSLGLLFSFALAVGASHLLSRRIQSIEEQVLAVREDDGKSPSASPQGRIILRELRSLERGVERMAHSVSSARREIDDRNKELECSNHQLRQEIDERKLAEREREASEAKFNSLFEDVPIPLRIEDLSGIVKAIERLGLTDNDDLGLYLDAHPEFISECRDAIVVVDANQAALELHRYSSRDKMVSRVVERLSPESTNVLRSTILAIHEGKSRLDYEVTVYPKTGESRRVSSTWAIVPGHEKTYKRILLTSVDITEALRSKERLLKAQKMEAVGQLTGGVAHDFNNLLTVIGGYVELIDEDPQNAIDYIPPVLKAVRQGAQLTQHLLAFSRQQPLAPKSIDVQGLVSDSAEMFRRTLGDNIEIEFDPEPDLWKAKADPTQVQNALLNLALNSRDAMPSGGRIVIRCGNTRIDGEDQCDLAKGDYVKISVQDDGVGMPPDVLARVFEPFFSTKEVGQGSGLGLSMVYGFAKQSHGHADVTSVPGQGTTVSIYLPRIDADDVKPEAQEVTTHTKKGNGEKVLILEDQKDVQTFLTHALKRAGFIPLAAHDAKSADSVLEMYPDLRLALCDIMLPGGVSGIEFATDAKMKRPDLKIIFLSGQPPNIDGSLPPPLQDCLVLVKPVETHLLLKALSEHS